jgi:hypothetical protein
MNSPISTSVNILILLFAASEILIMLYTNNRQEYVSNEKFGIERTEMESNFNSKLFNFIISLTFKIPKFISVNGRKKSPTLI